MGLVAGGEAIWQGIPSETGSLCLGNQVEPQGSENPQSSAK